MNLLAALVVFFLAVIPVQARSGCCSYHGGVCGCGCCDGSGLSATCLPYYPGCGGGGSYYSAPVYIPLIPENPITQGQTSVVQSSVKPYFTVGITWNSNFPVSISMTRAAGANPGPNADTSGGSFQFINVTSGHWYINIKAAVSGTWSKVSYWTVDVPEWIDPTPTPTPAATATPTPTSIVTPTSSTPSTGSDIVTSVIYPIGLGAIGFFILGKIVKFLAK